MIRSMLGKILAFYFFFHLGAAYGASASGEFVNGDVQVDPKVGKLLEDPGVKQIYDNCKNNPTQGTNLSDCLWNAVSANPDLKKKVLEMAKAQSSEGAVGLGIEENFSTDPALLKLGEVIKGKLNEALYGNSDSSKKTIHQAVDQRSFNDIYRTELSKTIVDAFLSYCLDTTRDGLSADPGDPDAAKINRKKNIDSIKNDPSILTTNDKNNPLPKQWNSCIAKIADDCKGTNVGAYKKNRACLVTQYVEASRKNLTVLDETDKIYDNLKNISPDRHANKDLKNLAVLTTVTSKDIDTAYTKAGEEAIEDMKRCKDQNDSEKCKKFLNTNTNDNKKGLAEFTLRQMADKEEFDKQVNAIGTSEEALKKFLLSRGYKQDSIDKMDLSKIEDVKKNIRERYDNEKSALIKEMNDRVESKTALDNGRIDKNKDENKLQTIKDELASRTDNMKHLVFFNNVVSGYLQTDITTIGNKDAKADRNTASLATELNSNEENKIVKEKLERAQGSAIADPNADSKSSSTTLGIDVDNILAPAAEKKEK